MTTPSKLSTPTCSVRVSNLHFEVRRRVAQDCAVSVVPFDVVIDWVVRTATVAVPRSLTHIHTDAQTHRRTDAQTHRRTDAQTHIRTDAQTHTRTDAQTQ